jgi:hypothetical protein
MINERIDLIAIADGEAVQVRFDLPDADLTAVARSVGTVADERYRGAALTAEDVLELRDLMALRDAAAERAADGYAGGTLVVSVRRLGLLVTALRDWLARRLEAGFLRHDQAVDHPAVERLAGELAELHGRALEAAPASGTRGLALAAAVR